MAEIRRAYSLATLPSDGYPGVRIPLRSATIPGPYYPLRRAASVSPALYPSGHSYVSDAYYGYPQPYRYRDFLDDHSWRYYSANRYWRYYGWPYTGKFFYSTPTYYDADTAAYRHYRPWQYSWYTYYDSARPLFRYASPHYYNSIYASYCFRRSDPYYCRPRDFSYTGLSYTRWLA